MDTIDITSNVLHYSQFISYQLAWINLILACFDSRADKTYVLLAGLSEYSTAFRTEYMLA